MYIGTLEQIRTNLCIANRVTARICHSPDSTLSQHHMQPVMQDTEDLSTDSDIVARSGIIQGYKSNSQCRSNNNATICSTECSGHLQPFSFPPPTRFQSARKTNRASKGGIATLDRTPQQIAIIFSCKQATGREIAQFESAKWTSALDHSLKSPPGAG